MKGFPETVGRLLNGPITIVGLGVSNLPLAEFLFQKGLPITIRDRHGVEELGEGALALQKKGVPFFTGDHYLDYLTEKVIFRAPGIRPDLPEFQRAVQNGAIISSEIELLMALVPSPIFGITGSDGKTTTTTLVGRILSASCDRLGVGKTYVGGNIGNSLFPDVEKVTQDDYVVLELSSFQLFDISCSVEYATVTNVSPNHLNWHKDYAEYIRAKSHIFSFPQNRRLVANAENEISYGMTQNHPAAVSLFSSKKHFYREFTWLGAPGTAIYARDGMIFSSDGIRESALLQTDEILLPGKHNLENVMTAIALTDGFASPEDLQNAIRGFRGVPHRLEYIATVDGVKYYNSSIDSTPTRTSAALSALSESPIVICGGYDKNVPFEPLAEALGERAKAVILTGATTEKIRMALKKKSCRLPIFEAPDFSDAVHLARKTATPGDTVLLSPACASFDAFRNFEERGNLFRKIVEGFSSQTNKK